MKNAFLSEMEKLMKLESNFVDVFSKYYGFDKLDKSNPYYELKKQNYEAVKESYKNKIILPNTHPIRATIQTTYCCNLNCIMCQLHSQYASQQLQSMRKNAMKKDDFDKIATELFPYLVEVHPTNVGEPLVSPWFDYMCDVVQKYGVLFDITSNGMLWTEEKILKILPSLLDIKISFEGIKKETFASISKGSDYKKICKNIDTFLFLRKQSHSQATITLQMTLLDINYHELLDIIRFAKDKGIDRVKAYHVKSYFSEMDQHFLLKSPENEALFEEVRTSAIALAENLGIALEISEPRAKMEDCSLISQHCRLPWGEVFIDYDASAYPCHSHKNMAYGNLISQNWLDVWNSEYAQKIRHSLINLSETEKTICKNCGMNFLKYDENQCVPHDISGYLSNNNEQINSSEIRWSDRSRQFELKQVILYKGNFMDEKKLIEIQKKLLHDRPVFGLEIITNCNKHCYICPRQNFKRKNQKMSMETFEKLCAWLPKECDIFFAGYGEPLLHPDCMKFVQKFAERGNETSIMTNGKLLSPEKIKDLFEHGLDRLQISVLLKDGIEQLQHFADMTDSCQAKKIEFNVLYEENMTTECDFVNSIREKGFTVRFKLIHNRGNELYQTDWTDEIRTCGSFFILGNIDTNGNLNICSQDINGVYDFGNISNMTFDEYMAYKRQFLGNKSVIPICDHCNDEYRLIHLHKYDD